MYIWRPSDTEIEEYRISVSRKKLMRYIEKVYTCQDIVFLESDEEFIYVQDKEGYEFGFISLITEI